MEDNEILSTIAQSVQDLIIEVRLLRFPVPERYVLVVEPWQRSQLATSWYMLDITGWRQPSLFEAEDILHGRDAGRTLLARPIL